MNTQNLNGKQYAEWLLAQVTAAPANKQRLTRAADGLALDDEDFEAFAARELEDLNDGMIEQEREQLA